MGQRAVSMPEAVTLLLSGRCNLACAYCYLDPGRPRTSMRWETLASTLATLLGSGAVRLELEFTGGEPLLEADLIRRAVDFIRRHRSAETRIELSLTTNGTLLDAELLSFLFARGFSLRISCDGVRAAQDLRGPRTFAILDRLFHRLRREYPEELGHRVTAAVTVVAATIPYLAESVRYLVGTGVGKIAIGPRLTWDPDWTQGSRDELERQVAGVVELSAEHWRRTRLVPVGFLARPPLRERDAPVGDVLCHAFAGSTLCVDPSGQLLVCPSFAGSFAALPPLARRVARTAGLGSLSDGTLMRRLATLPRRARASRVVSHALAKRSSYGSCAECRFLPDCLLCPASICHIPGNQDPDLVPDFICAFNQVTLAARESFDALTDGKVSEAWYGEMTAALARVASVVKKTAASSQDARPRTAASRSVAPGLTAAT
jgi:sulfatase maturation enzyme AslB (radical SAM superfamily)